MTGFLTPPHILLLMVVLLLVFGAKRLPELGRSLGSGLREFKRSVSADPTEDRPALTAVSASDAGRPAVRAAPITAPAQAATVDDGQRRPAA
jgi:sec-independent protein translocase protein TatA